MSPDNTALKECPAIWGTALINDQTPSIEFHNYLTFLPFSGQSWYASDPLWGIYNKYGQLIDAAAYYSVLGQTRVLTGQSIVQRSTINVAHFEPGSFVYIGTFVGHYGHFMMDCLSRLWPFADPDNGIPTDARLVLHAYGDEADVFLRDYIREIFRALDIDQSRLLVPKQPTLLEHVIIPRTSFEVNHFAHPAFKTLCQKVGGQLDSGNFDEGPYYFSRSRLTSGNFDIVNENILEAALESHGVKIVHPQQLSFQDQVTVARRASHVYAVVGSALHNLIFANSPRKVRGLNLGPALNSNFSLVDRLYGNDGRYLYTDGIHHLETNTPGFVESFSIEHPERVIEQLMAAS